MKDHGLFNSRGITLIELLVALVIFGFVVGGIYRLFVAQTKAYTVQDQVADVQQNVRSAMEILLRDLRMAGYDEEKSPIVINTTFPPYEHIVYPPQDNSIIINYEYYDTATSQFQKHTISYWFDVPLSRLMRQLTVNNVAGPQEVLVENVDTFELTYGVDGEENGAMDDRNGDGVINESDFISASNVGTMRVVAVRVRLTARPSPNYPDIHKMISPRTLVSTVTFRNLCLR